MDWCFKDPPNLAVIASEKIIKLRDFIAYVTHDDADGGWQFHCKGQISEIDVAVVSLQSIFNIDVTVGELADLPMGWHAWRNGLGEPWQKGKQSDAE